MDELLFASTTSKYGLLNLTLGLEVSPNFFTPSYAVIQITTNSPNSGKIVMLKKDFGEKCNISRGKVFTGEKDGIRKVYANVETTTHLGLEGLMLSEDNVLWRY